MEIFEDPDCEHHRCAAQDNKVIVEPPGESSSGLYWCFILCALYCVLAIMCFILCAAYCTHARTDTRAHHAHTRARTRGHTRERRQEGTQGSRRVVVLVAKPGCFRGDTIRLTLSLPVGNSSGNDSCGTDTKSVAACRRGPAAAAENFGVSE
jgi:hypothetical protein